MRSYFEKMAVERKQAIEREYQRAVKYDLFEDTRAAREAFLCGWYGTHNFEAAKKERNEAGSNWYMLSVLLLVVGALAFCTPFIAFATSPIDKIDVGNAFAIGTFGGFGIVAGFYAQYRAREQADKGADRFETEWMSL